MKITNNKTIIFLLFNTLSLSGCSTFFSSSYHEPESGPTANVSFVNENEGYYFHWPWQKKEEEYLHRWSVQAYDEANGCVGRRSIVTASTGPSSVGERTAHVKVKADKEFAFSINYEMPYLAYCKFIASFVPDENASYQISFGVSERDTGDKCYMSIAEELGNRNIPIKAKLKKWADPGFGDSFCEKD